MHVGHRFAAYLARLLFAPDGTKITRKQCAFFGALALVVWNLLIAALALLVHSFADAPTPEALPFGQTVAGQLASWLVIAVPPVAAFGALGGLVRYQMKQGTDEEISGGGGGLQVLLALPAAILMFPFIVVLAPVFLLLSLVLRKDLFGDGTTGWIPVGCISLAVAAVVIASSGGLGKDEIMVWRLVAGQPADIIASWFIFTWNDQRRLATPAERAVPTRFSLGALLAAILSAGAYATLLVLAFY